MLPGKQGSLHLPCCFPGRPGTLSGESPRAAVGAGAGEDEDTGPPAPVWLGAGCPELSLRWEERGASESLGQRWREDMRGGGPAHLVSLGACDSSGALQREGSVLGESGNARHVLPPWTLSPKAGLCAPLCAPLEVSGSSLQPPVSRGRAAGLRSVSSTSTPGPRWVLSHCEVGACLGTDVAPQHQHANGPSAPTAA